MVTELKTVLQEIGWDVLYCEMAGGRVSFPVIVPTLPDGQTWSAEELRAIGIVAQKLFDAGEEPPFTIGGNGSVEGKPRV